eukprot:scaffold69276_cov27-Cyclotella_meneghiniana.AAC.2
MPLSLPDFSANQSKTLKTSTLVNWSSATPDSSPTNCRTGTRRPRPNARGPISRRSSVKRSRHGIVPDVPLEVRQDTEATPRLTMRVLTSRRNNSTWKVSATSARPTPTMQKHLTPWPTA